MARPAFAHLLSLCLLMFGPSSTGGQEAQARPPLRLDEVVRLLTAGVTSTRLQALVHKYGIDFPVESSVDVLRAARADDAVIDALRNAASPAPSASPSRPSPAASPRAATLSPARAILERAGLALVRGGPKGDIYLAKHEVTNQEYWEYCRRWNLPRPEDPPLGKPLPSWPVVNVTWDDAVRYCSALSRETGHTYRLPTEVEWELAASAGDARRTYPWGDESPNGRACFRRASLCPVGSFGPNALGLFDMAGSVAEWVIGKQGETVVKGGSWATSDDFSELEISSRVKMGPGKRSYKVGLRVAVEP